MAGRIAYYGGIVTNGLVLDLDAAKKDSYPGTGTSWRDISGNSNNGTLTNGPTFNSNNGGAIVFDGVDDYVQLVKSTSTDLSGPFTLAAWFKSSSNSSLLLSRDRTGSTAFTFFMFNNNRPRLLLQNGNSSLDCTSTNTYANNNFYYFVTVLTSSQVLHYVNGVLDSTFNSGGILPIYPTNSNGWTIGGLPTTIFSFYTAQTQYTTQIYNRALTQAEITQNYNALKGRYGL